MALSNKRIKDEMGKGAVIIVPFDEKNLSTSSYDVTLGEYYFDELQKGDNDFVYNPYNKKDVDMVWGTEPKRAGLAKEVLQGQSFEFDGIAEDDKVILLPPGRTVLAHTNEFIGGRHHVTTMMKARSSLGRNFIEVCKCAGWGDVGYVNRWTMEITNNSLHYHIPLVVGRRIAQIVFLETGPIEGVDYSAAGKYQTTESLDELMENWDPKSMLPKMYNDRELRKN